MTAARFTRYYTDLVCWSSQVAMIQPSTIFNTWQENTESTNFLSERKIASYAQFLKFYLKVGKPKHNVIYNNQSQTLKKYHISYCMM